MTTIELAEHPELAVLLAAASDGGSIEILDHGRPVFNCVPISRQRSEWLASLEALHKSFTSPPYPGNSVIDMRRESR